MHGGWYCRVGKITSKKPDLEPSQCDERCRPTNLASWAATTLSAFTAPGRWRCLIFSAKRSPSLQDLRAKSTFVLNSRALYAAALQRLNILSILNGCARTDWLSGRRAVSGCHQESDAIGVLPARYTSVSKTSGM